MSGFFRYWCVLGLFLILGCGPDKEQETAGGEHETRPPAESPLTHVPTPKDESSTPQEHAPEEASPEKELEQDNPYAEADPIPPQQEFDLGDPVRFDWDAYNRENGSVFILIGGSTNCGEDQGPGLGLGISRPFRSMLQLIATVNNTEPDALIVCYPRKKTYFGRVQTLWVQDYHGGSIKQLAPQQLAEEIIAFANSRSISILGHSKGAGLGMHTAIDLINRHQSKLEYFVTIDPISPYECTRAFDKDCWRLPPGISTADRQTIASNTSGWLHFFQRVTRVMMSNDIPEANERKKRALLHAKMDTDRDIWDIISDRIVPKG